jgi:hypothetical protein
LVNASDVCGSTTVMLLSATSDEADDAPGDDDGETTGDVQGATPGTPDFDLTLRAERDRTGPGRTYSVRYSARDGSTNETIQSGLVTVPIDVGGVVEPLIMTVDLVAGAAGPDGALLRWDPIAGALNYNVVVADLGGVIETADRIDLGAVSCLEADSVDTDTSGNEDSVDPALGAARIYFVDYDDGRRISYGTETARKPRIPASGDCP